MERYDFGQMQYGTKIIQAKHKNNVIARVTFPYSISVNIIFDLVSEFGIRFEFDTWT